MVQQVTRNDRILTLCLMVVWFFSCLYITVPIIQLIWRILVLPQCKTPLPSGVIIFVLLISSLFRRNGEIKEKTFADNFIAFIEFYSILCITLGMSLLYSYFI